MPELHLAILPPSQRKLWDTLTERADRLRQQGYYLAGGTALALQLGHRRSVDFDFFSQQRGLGPATEADWQQLPGFLTRDIDADTLHAELAGVKLSFIGGYRYPLLEAPIDAHGIHLASILDLALMKLLAISHRATTRDYIDLAAILQQGVSLTQILSASTQKYGSHFNPMVPLRALVTFSDLDPELPTILDPALASSWQDILRTAVRAAGLGK